MNLRNLKHSRSGSIDCEYEHPKFGWIPFTAHPSDVEPLGAEIYAACISGGYGEIAAADIPVIEQQIAQVVSPRQIRQALTRAGLRSAVEAAVASGDQDLKDWWEFATEFQRTNQHVLDMAAALNVTNQQLDDLWTLAASL